MLDTKNLGQSGVTRQLLRRASAACLLGAMAAAAQAGVTTYTDPVAWAAALGQAPIPVNFDDLANNAPLANQYPEVGFSALNGGRPLAVEYSFAQSGLNLVSLGQVPLTGGGGGVRMDFGQPQHGVAMWYLDSEFAGNQVTVHSGSLPEAVAFEMVHPNPDPIAWRFVGFIDSAMDIRRVDVLIGDSDFVALDSLQLAPVPEPSTAALMLLGAALLFGARQHRSATRPSRTATPRALR